MPPQDGTGPRGLGQRSFPKRKGLGGTSECVCPKCGYKEAHTRNVPCSEIKCPKCDSMMTGEFCATEGK